MNEMTIHAGWKRKGDEFQSFNGAITNTRLQLNNDEEEITLVRHETRESSFVDYYNGIQNLCMYLQCYSGSRR